MKFKQAHKVLFNSSPLIYTLLYIVLPAYAVFLILDKPLIGTDDFNIYLQYALNFSSGKGIVYNIGGEHVEGFSSTLYFLVCSFFNLFTNTPEIIILLFNLFLAIASGILMLNTIKLISKKFDIPEINIPLIFFLYLFWIFINPPFFGWTIISLMDSGIYTFLLILSYTYFVKIIINDTIEKGEHSKVSGLLFLIIMARPEGILWAAVYLFIYFLLNYRIEQTIIFAFKKILIPATVFIVTILSLTLYRLFYFGYPLPNTYYTKVSASLLSTLKDGFGYFNAFLEMYSPLILLPLIVLCFWVVYAFIKKQKSQLFYIAYITLIFVIVGLLLPIIEGGDHFKAFRFYQSIYPLLIMPFVVLLFIFNKAKSFKLLLINVVVVSALLFQFNKADWNSFFRNNNPFQVPQDYSLCMEMEFDIAKYTRENGRRLNDVFKGQLPIIGFGAAGGIAIGYDGIVYDMMGLNLTKLAHADAIKVGPKAHQSFNKKVFYELAPDILMPTAELSSASIVLSKTNDYYSNINSWDNLIYKNIFNDNEFKQKYTLAVVFNTAQPTYVCYGYFNNNYLQTLNKTNKFRIKNI